MAKFGGGGWLRKKTFGENGSTGVRDGTGPLRQSFWACGLMRSQVGQGSTAVLCTGCKQLRLVLVEQLLSLEGLAALSGQLLGQTAAPASFIQARAEGPAERAVRCRPARGGPHLYALWNDSVGQILLLGCTDPAVVKKCPWGHRPPRTCGGHRHRGSSAGAPICAHSLCAVGGTWADPLGTQS